MSLSGMWSCSVVAEAAHSPTRAGRATDCLCVYVYVYVYHMCVCVCVSRRWRRECRCRSAKFNRRSMDRSSPERPHPPSATDTQYTIHTLLHSYPCGGDGAHEPDRRRRRRRGRGEGGGPTHERGEDGQLHEAAPGCHGGGGADADAGAGAGKEHAWWALCCVGVWVWVVRRSEEEGEQQGSSVSCSGSTHTRTICGGVRSNSESRRGEHGCRFSRRSDHSAKGGPGARGAVTETEPRDKYEVPPRSNKDTQASNKEARIQKAEEQHVCTPLQL
jgi:hypothetical protein